MSLAYPLPRLHSDVAALLRALRSDLIVIGSVARGNKPPGDLDIWINGDGFVRGEERYKRHQRLIRETGLAFVSNYPAHWAFDSYPPMQVELIGIPNIGISFIALRRLSMEKDVGGVSLRVAPPEYAGVATKGSKEQAA